MSMDRDSKSGQAIIEFMIGLVGIMILVLGLSQIAQIVNEDIENMFAARESVAEDLLNRNQGNYNGDLPVDTANIYNAMQTSIDPDGTYSGFRSLYPADAEREDRMAEIWNGGDPLKDMVGSEPTPRTIPISSPFFQKAMGRSSIQVNNVVYMPPWDDLM
jgi:hypothetical protein